jgi:prolipoprotein diacylglyceryltransferase
MVIIYMNTPTLVVILLTILSILVFLKTVPFIFLSSNMLNIDKYFGIDIEPKLDLFNPNDIVQNFLSFIFIITAIIIVYKRNFHNDIVNYVMYYLIIVQIIRFYFVFFSQTQLMSVGFQNLTKITIVTMFLLSLYIIKKIFF